MKTRHCGPDVPEIDVLAKVAGGWKPLAASLGENPGSLQHMARGRRKMSPKVRQAAEAAGHRPAGWSATVAAILDWADSPAPRRRWRSLTRR